MPREYRPCGLRWCAMLLLRGRATAQSIARYAMRLSLCVTCVSPLSGCVCLSPRSVVAITADERAGFRARAAIEFAAGVFYKPREDAAGGVESELAPLIIQQVDAAARTVASEDRFGVVVCDSDGDVRIDITQPTVYRYAAAIEVGGDEFASVFYYWFRPPASDSRGWARCQMLALALDREGFPAVLEVVRFDLGKTQRLGSDSRPRILFVSASAELRAKERFGPPLSGRTYSIEREIRDAPNTVVARLIEDGPIPMGPFVYLEAGTLDVTTLACRCSPSQVDEIVETRYYDLVPMEHLPAAVAERLGAWTGSRRFDPSPGTAPANLADVLRWPGR